jgi:hypothetical protein
MSAILDEMSLLTACKMSQFREKLKSRPSGTTFEEDQA